MRENKNCIINKDDFIINLNKVNYEKIEFNEEHLKAIEKVEKIVIETEDSFEIMDYSDQELVLEFKRQVFHKPEFFYRLEVVLEIVYSIDCEKKVDYETLIEEIKSQKIQLLSPVIHRASLLISNITNVDSEANPTITPPFYKEDD